MSELLHIKNIEECSICLEEIKTNDCCTTKCNHTFHLSCLLKSTSKSNFCPNCRFLIKESIIEDDDIEDEIIEDDDIENEYHYNNYYYINHNYDGDDQLILTSIYEDINYLKDLIDNGFDLDNIDRCGKTALSWAVSKNKLQSVKMLLEAGSNPNILSYHDDNPLFISIYERNLEVLNILLQNNNININLKNSKGHNALHIAIYNGFFDAIKLLINSGIDVNSKDNNGISPLLMTYDHDIIMYLLKYSRNIDINMKDNNNKNILFYAIECSYYDIIKKIISKDIEINAKNNYGNTGLITAVYMNSVNIVKILLTVTNIDLNIKNIFGLSALDIAIEKNKTEIIVLLKNAGAV